MKPSQKLAGLRKDPLIKPSEIWTAVWQLSLASTVLLVVCVLLARLAQWLFVGASC